MSVKPGQAQYPAAGPDALSARAPGPTRRVDGLLTRRPRTKDGRPTEQADNTSLAAAISAPGDELTERCPGAELVRPPEGRFGAAYRATRTTRPIGLPEAIGTSEGGLACLLGMSLTQDSLVRIYQRLCRRPSGSAKNYCSSALPHHFLHRSSELTELHFT